MKRISVFKKTALLVLSLFMLLSLSGCFDISGKLTVTIPKIGKADCIFLKTSEASVLIDAGEDDDAAEIEALITSGGTNATDVFIITHFDKDHIGSAAYVLEYFEVKRLILPDYPCATALYFELLAAAEEAGVTPEFISRETEFSVGGMDFKLYPTQTQYAGDNDNSLVVRLSYAGSVFLFAGDIEEDRSCAMIGGGFDFKCDFIKIPHHGKSNKASRALIDAAGADYAVICDSEKNPADGEVLSALKENNTVIFETKDGNVTVYCDKKGITVKQ